MVEILLATYNSEKYLKEQLDSILAQNDQNWRLLIRDGGSSDSTSEILEQYLKTNPEKIKLLPSSGRAGYVENFSRLLDASSEHIVMFCDHDDVWFPTKVESAVAKIQEMEAAYSQETPIFVHCEATITDSDLNPIAERLHEYWHFSPDINLEKMPIEIPVFGCMIAMNRPMIGKIKSIPFDCGAHDMWCGRVAWFLGKVGYVPEPQMFYRVHKNNTSLAGTDKYPWVLFRWLFQLPILRGKLYTQLIYPSKLFFERYEKEIPPRYLPMLRAASKLADANFFMRKYYILRYHIRANGYVRTLGFLFLS